MTISVFLDDDHGVVRAGLRAYLDAEPGVVVIGEADNGRDAVKQITILQPDVAVLDIGMPELDGIEATEQVNDRHASTRIIILSMHASNEHVFRALQAGASGFVAKESAGKELVKAVHTVNTYRSRLMKKLDISDMPTLVKFAIRHGLTDLE